MLPVLGYFAVCLAGLMLYLQFRDSRSLANAERKLAALMAISLNRSKLESLRDELLTLKKLAVEKKFPNMERFYEIEHKMNLLSVKLDQIERALIDEGLQQPSEKGRLEYMLKLVNLGIAAA